MKKVKDKAHWAFQLALKKKIISDTDSALIFQSWDDLQFNLEQLKNAFNHPNVIHAIAIKTNPHPEVLAKIISWGFGLEAASFEELELAIKAGAPMNKIIFDSPVKRVDEIKTCHKQLNGIRLNANSLEELKRIPKKPNFILGLRINPSLKISSPELYNVSKNESKFGVPISEKKALLHAILTYPIVQLHIHAGSQMKDMNNAVSAVRQVLDLAIEANKMLEKKGIKRRITSLDIGGGLAAEKYGESKKMIEYAKLLELKCPELLKFELITEFGQWCHTHSGFIFSEVEYAIQRDDTRIAFIHLGADYFMRDAYTTPRDFQLLVLNKKGNPKPKTKVCKHDIAGPLCFAGDYVLKGALLPKIEEHDWLGIIGTGANTLGLWSRHCSRKIPKIIGFSREKNEMHILSERSSL